MRKILLALAFAASLFALPANAANFSAKDAAAATIIFTNPGNCTTGCTPIFAWADSTGANLVAVLTAGADAASNTANGGIVYNRNMVFNGTTWDRWQGAIKAASGAFASGSIASGAMVDLGSQADAACGTDTGTCSTIALIKRGNQNTAAAIPAGSNLIGSVKQSDGTSTRVYDPCEIVAHVTTPVSISAAATSVIVAGTSAKKTYICAMMLYAAGTTNVGIVQGSGSTCGTSTLGLIGGATAATGPNLVAQTGFVAGNGNFAIAGTTVNANDICLINSAAIQVSGFIVTATP